MLVIRTHCKGEGLRNTKHATTGKYLVDRSYCVIEHNNCQNREENDDYFVLEDIRLSSKKGKGTEISGYKFTLISDMEF